MTRNSEARMTLVEHLRELRNRLARALMAVGLGTLAGWVWYPPIFELLYRPFRTAALDLDTDESQTILAMTGIADAFNVQFHISIAAGLVLASPVWLYQTFRFVTPGLHAKERKWAGIFVAAALPLFLAGAASAYFTLPRVLEGFLGFTPDGVSNVIGLDRYLTFFVQVMIAFGFGCVAPVLLVVLNAAGVLSARQLVERWRWLLLFTLLFAGIATPTGDPVVLAMFASPLVLLMAVAVGICWYVDRRRRQRSPYGDVELFRTLGDDETSPLVRLDDLL